jgi:hypothetical protein
MACFFLSSRKPSINLISPPWLGFDFSRAWMISGVTMYLPMMARLDGAFAGVGFSTKFSIS